MRRGLLTVLMLAVAACHGEPKAVASRTPAAAAPDTTAHLAPRKAPRKKIAAEAEEAAGAIEERLDVARREIKDQFATRLAGLLASTNNRADYWGVVMDSAARPDQPRAGGSYDAHFKLTGDNCRFSPGDSVATYECDIGDAAPFADLGSRLAAYADASRQVIPSSWILAGEDGAFRAVNPFCRAEQIRFAAGDTLRLIVTLPYGEPCGLPYSASTSKS
jgi:hypothetical protein